MKTKYQRNPMRKQKTTRKEHSKSIASRDKDLILRWSRQIMES